MAVYVAFAQTENQTKQSYRKGLSVVSASFEAMGGATNLDKIEDVSYTLAGTLHARNQSFSPDPPFDTFPIETRIIYDLKKDRVHWEQRNGLPGGIFFVNRILANKNGGFNLTLDQKNHTILPANPPVFLLANRLLPIVFLQKVLAQKASLRSMGEAVINGKKQDVVGFNLDNQQFTAYFDATSKLLTKYEIFVPDNFAGDHLVEYFYGNYQTHKGLLLPTKYTQLRAGKIIRESSYSDFKFNQKPNDSLFALPADFPLFQPPSSAIKPLAKDVFLAEGLAGGAYRCLIVNLNDGILVVDAPGSSVAMTDFIDQLKRTIPGKPIKYLVATHFHDDHTGGIRTFIAEGSKIITTERNKKFFEQFANAEYTINPDLLSRQPKNPDFMFVEKNQSFSYAEGTFEIYKLDKNSHAKDLYVVYLPKEKTVFQSDLYNWQKNAVTMATVEFVEEIEKLNWQVETVIGSHSGAVPYQQIKDEVKEFKAKK